MRTSPILGDWAMRSTKCEAASLAQANLSRPSTSLKFILLVRSRTNTISIASVQESGRMSASSRERECGKRVVSITVRPKKATSNRWGEFRSSKWEIRGCLTLLKCTPSEVWG